MDAPLYFHGAQLSGSHELGSPGQGGQKARVKKWDVRSGEGERRDRVFPGTPTYAPEVVFFSQLKAV